MAKAILVNIPKPTPPADVQLTLSNEEAVHLRDLLYIAVPSFSPSGLVYSELASVLGPSKSGAVI